MTAAVKVERPDNLESTIVNSKVLSRRFWSYVITEGPDDCWLWKGWTSDQGYGRLAIRTVPLSQQFAVRAHRISYIAFYGEIPEGKEIDYICRVRNCVNPLHLRAITTAENVLCGNGPTAINKRKVFCNRGHLLPENRTCLKCYRIARLKRDRKRKKLQCI